MKEYTRIEVPDWMDPIEKLVNQRYAATEELKNYDYIGVKIAMGVATKEQYKDKIIYTESVRYVINEIDKEMKELEESVEQLEDTDE